MSKRRYYTAVGKFAINAGFSLAHVPADRAGQNAAFYEIGRAAIAKNRAYLKKKISGYGPATRTALARFRRSARGGEFLRKSALLLGALDMHRALLRAGVGAEQAAAQVHKLAESTRKK